MKLKFHCTNSNNFNRQQLSTE